MFVWPAYPFIRLTLAYIVGILVYHHYQHHLDFTTVYLIIGSITLSILFFVLDKFKLITISWQQGTFLLLVIMSFGYTRTNDYDHSNSKTLSSELFSKTKSYTALVTSYPIHKGRNYTYEVETRHLRLPDTVIAHSQSVKLYISTNANTPPLKYGDLISVKSSPFEIEGPSNPHEFDYAGYMALSNIFYQSFTKPYNLTILTQNQANPLMATVYRWRNYFETTILKAVDNKESQGIALALLLGIKDRLDTDTKNAYAAAGAMHVLAVSGLHIGIIHFIIIWMFKPIKSAIFKRHFLPIISIILLWLYALITGFSPSIMRAATMFSIILYGQSLNRTPNIFNSIFLSAFILLIFNPNQLFSVGFQLSYLAVLGIVYLYPMLYKLYIPKYWLVDKAWSITCVSIVAQLATFPLSLTYFHQFPSYFLLSNLVVIPTAFAIMILGIAQLAIGWLTPFYWIKHLLSGTLNFLNLVVYHIEILSGSLIDWINLTAFDSLCIYTFILLTLAFLHSKSYSWLRWAMMCSLLFCMNKSTDIIAKYYGKELIIYDIKNKLVIEEINGLNSFLYSDSDTDNLKLLSHQINPNRLRSYLDPITTPLPFESTAYVMDSSLYFYSFAGEKLVFVLEGHQLENIKFKINSDYLFIENDAISDLTKINSLFTYDQLILRNSNSYRTIKTLSRQAELMNISLHITADKYWKLKAVNESNNLGWSF